MTLKEYVKQNRQQLRSTVRQRCPNNRYLGTDDELLELEDWVMNEEDLYQQALIEGVEDL